MLNDKTLRIYNRLNQPTVIPISWRINIRKICLSYLRWLISCYPDYISYAAYNNYRRDVENLLTEIEILNRMKRGEQIHG